MRIIFLDIDGVLNSTRSAVGLGGYGHMRHNYTRKQLKSKTRLDPVAMGLLKRILVNSEAKIVISSTWRFHNPRVSIVQFNRLFKAYGLPQVVVGSTGRSGDGHRGTEIGAWLCNQPEGTISDYVILDDDSDMTEQQLDKNFYKVDGEVGLDFQTYLAIRDRWFLDKL